MIPQDSTTVTLSQVYNDFKGALAGAAEALKTTSEHVYEVMVRQQVVNSVSWCLIIALCLVTGLVMLSTTLKHFKKKEKDEDAEDFFNAIGILGVIIFCIGGTVALFTIDIIITGFVNPEYGAIMEIKEFIR